MSKKKDIIDFCNNSKSVDLKPRTIDHRKIADDTRERLSLTGKFSPNQLDSIHWLVLNGYLHSQIEQSGNGGFLTLEFKKTITIKI